MFDFTTRHYLPYDLFTLFTLFTSSVFHTFHRHFHIRLYENSLRKADSYK